VVGGGQRTFDATTDPIGNGRAVSMLLAREGSKVAVADLNLKSAQNTVEQIISEGGQAISLQADISREDDVARMIEQARSNLPGLDGLVLVVGIFENTNISKRRENVLDEKIRG
jgi:NAD(P)-dependent dehydrogenase (short-subunit alcohol dehydrogenase family)